LLSEDGVRSEVDRLTREHESLHAVIEAISGELELRPLLTSIVRHACELLRADDGTIGLVDESRGLVRTEAAYRMPAGELGAEMGPGVGLAGSVLARRAPVVFARYADVPDPTQPELLDNAVLGVPILWRARLIGVFGLGARPPRRFDDDDVRTLELLARHAAVAIENARLYEREQRRSERLALIARVGQIITAGLDLDELLQRAADAIHELLGYPTVDVPLIDLDDPETLVVRVRGGRYKALIAHEDRLPINAGIMGAAVRERRVQLVNDVQADPRYVRPPAGGVQMHAELAIPILLGSQVLGVLNVESESPFVPDDAASLQIVADHLAVAIRNARLFRSAQLLAVLEERQRLARDLHDSVAQMLFTVTLLAQAVGPAWRRDAEEGERKLERLLELTRGALTEMRALLAELRPAEPVPELAHAVGRLSSAARVRQQGLVGALRRHLHEVIAEALSHTASSGAPAPRLRVRARGWQPLALEHEEVLYRIAQEALHNAVKHAAARRLEVTLRRRPGQALLRVRDDGRGFDVRAALRRAARGRRDGGGLGLLSMRERAEAIGGRLLVRSSAERGTRVDVLVPVEGEERA
jgi:signal transduction histidine kinase